MTEVYTCECGAIADNPHQQVHHNWQPTTLAQVIVALQDRIVQLERRLDQAERDLQERDTSCNCGDNK